MNSVHFFFRFFVSVCLFVVTTRSHRINSSLHLNFTTAHSRSYKFFCQPFVHEILNFAFDMFIFVVLEEAVVFNILIGTLKKKGLYM